jgi:DNA-binding XRE family transcriptional regulator
MEKMAKVDKKWFIDRLNERGESQASMARALGIDKSAMSLLLSGRRRLHAEMCDQIAGFLRLPVDDVLAAAGFSVRKPAASGNIPLVGYVNAQFVVTMISDSGSVSGHPALSGGTVAVRVQTAGTDADWMDGWLLFFEPANGMAPQLITRLCIAELDNSQRRVGTLRRGYTDNTYNLMLPGGDMVENVTVRAATQLSWIKP